MSDVKHLTLCFIHDSDKILLAMKKRGFGEGWWNGYGGKLNPGESVEEAAIRELEEESGIKASKIEKMGFLVFEGEEDADFHTHIFRVHEYSGEPVETEEMSPGWFAHNKIPFENMWPDDIHWMPLFLRGQKFTGRFRIEDRTIVDYELSEVDSLE